MLIRTLVAMATYTCSFHRLIMGKWNLTISPESLGLFEYFLLQKCLLSSPP